MISKYRTKAFLDAIKYEWKWTELNWIFLIFFFLTIPLFILRIFNKYKKNLEQEEYIKEGLLKVYHNSILVKKIDFLDGKRHGI